MVSHQGTCHYHSTKISIVEIDKQAIWVRAPWSNYIINNQYKFVGSQVTGGGRRWISDIKQIAQARPQIPQFQISYNFCNKKAFHNGTRF